MQKFILERREGMPAKGNCVKLKVSWKKQNQRQRKLLWSGARAGGSLRIMMMVDIPNIQLDVCACEFKQLL